MVQRQMHEAGKKSNKLKWKKTIWPKEKMGKYKKGKEQVYGVNDKAYNKGRF